MKKIHVIKKFGFLVHEPSLYDHWIGIWNQLSPEEFDIIITGQFWQFLRDDNQEIAAKAATFVKLIKSSGIHIAFVNELEKQKHKYAFVISNHLLGGNSMKARIPIQKLTKKIINKACKLCALTPPFKIDPHLQYMALRCGINPIRIMYGADIGDSWSLASWNEQYKYILCHGPNDEKAVRSRFSAKTFQIGYPRYDSYFNKPVEQKNNPLVKEFSLLPEKQTVIWLPTLGDDVCSIPYYSEPIAKLRENFNVIVRPHPLALREDLGNIKVLEQHDFIIDRDDLRNMNHLYALADFVFCDYGGTSFSALYLDKNIILLNVPSAHSHSSNINSSNMELRELLDPVIDPEDAKNLEKLIENKDLWNQQDQQRKIASQRYFAPYQGNSAAQVCNTLRKIRDSQAKALVF